MKELYLTKAEGNHSAFGRNTCIVSQQDEGVIAYFQHEEDAKNFIQMKRIFVTDKPTPPPPPRVR